MKALKLLSTIFLLNMMISVQPVHAEDAVEIEEEVLSSEDVVEPTLTIESKAVDESAGENVPPEASGDQEESQEDDATEAPTPKEEENPNENNDSDVENPPEYSESGESNSTEEIDKQLRESDEQVLDAVRVEQKPSDKNNHDKNNYDKNANTQPEIDNNSSEVVEDNTVVAKEDNSKSKANNNKKEDKKKTPHGAKELPNTGIHENIELIYVLEIVLLTLGLLLLFRKSSKAKIRK